MTTREKLSAVLILTGMVLLCAEQLAGCIAGVALLGLGIMVINTSYISKPKRRKTRRTGRRVI